MDSLAYKATHNGAGGPQPWGDQQQTVDTSTETWSIDGPNAAGFHGPVSRKTLLSVAETQPEWVDIYPLTGSMSPSASRGSSGGGGNVEVHVYVDSTEVGKRVEVRQARAIYQGRRR